MNGLEVSHLRKQYGDFVAVSDLSLHVNRGEILGLIGPNGAGKSTSMLMITGLLGSDGGTVSFDGEVYDIQNSRMRSRFGIVPQDLAIYPELTAIQNLQFFGRLNGVYGPRLRQRVDYALNLTGLTDHAKQRVHSFSGGMARRLNFGIALVHEPQFVMLDEPTVGIDPQSRTNLLDGVRQLCTEGMGVLYASHYMEEVQSLCDRIAVMDHGQLLAMGTKDELLAREKPKIIIEIESLPEETAGRLEAFARIDRDPEGKSRVVITGVESDEASNLSRLRQVLELMERDGVTGGKVISEDLSLETVFLKLTGRRLRD